jgi:methylmalonyl-CoA mutase
VIALAADFPAPTRDDWMYKVGSVLLRGQPDADPEAIAEAFARRLVHRTEDGIEVQPLYTKPDDGADTGLPGFAPFVRGVDPVPQPWEIRQAVTDRGRAVEELEAGSTGLFVVLGSEIDALAARLDGVQLAMAPVSVSAGDQIAGARSLLALWDEQSVPAGARRGSLGLDPLGAHARSGGSTDLTADLDAAVAVALDSSSAAPNVAAFVADGTVFHEAGATPAQQIAWTTVVGAEYVRAMAAAGLDPSSALRAIEFRWSATDDQFGTIALLRAARRVWARVAELAGAEPADRAQRQHAVTARSMLTLYDPWVNVLRSTVACFAAAVGGARAITVVPHDELDGGSDLGRRLARNTQSVLLMESNLARVADIGGGSWYVESLTDDLAAAAWARVQDVEGRGGLAVALADGSIHTALADAILDRAAAVATRRRPLTGVTEFPDLTESRSGGPGPPADIEGTPFPPLVPVRLSDEVEALRLRADARAAGGARPAVFLVTLGSEAVYTPRLTFAQNFFGVGGIETPSGSPADYDAGDTPVVCLCSSDAVYGEEAEAVAAELRAGGATTVLLAGRRLDVDGVDGEIGLGTDVLATLSDVLRQLGVDEEAAS